MSLLLDALQRASQEKDKSSQATKPAKPTEIALEPATLPAVEARAPADVAAPRAPATPPQEPQDQPVPEKPALEFSFTPEEVPTKPVKEEPTATPNTPSAPAIAVPIVEMAAATPNPPSTPPPAVDTPKPVQKLASPPPSDPTPAGKRPSLPPLSPRTAREILGASAPNKASGKRLVVLASVACLLALALGGAYLFLGMPASNLTPQQPTTSAGAVVAPPPAVALPAATPEPTAPPPQGETGRPPEAPVVTAAAVTAPAASANEVKATPVAAGKTQTREAPSALAAETPTASPSPKRASTPASRPLLFAKSSASGNSALESAYSALLEGRLEVAAEAYRRALVQNNEERDALLGLGHIAHRQGKRDEARAYYERVLRLDPENAVANSGLLAMLAEGDPASAASRARDIAEKNPGSAAAFSTLGNILVREGNFAEAQQAFFRAATLEPASAFHAYNLAVALDRLHKSDLAANYYARALALGEKPGQQAFPKETARQRLEQLRAPQN